MYFLLVSPIYLFHATQDPLRWLLPPGTMLSRVFHTMTHQDFTPFISRYSAMWICPVLFLHLPVDGNCFYVCERFVLFLVSGFI